MKTDDLIRLMAEDAPVRFPLGRRVGLALGIGTVVAAVLLLATVGLRPNIAAALETLRVAFKVTLTLLLAVTAICLVLRVGRPDASLKPIGLCLLIPLALLILAMGLELTAVPSAEWSSRLVGVHAAFCVFCIPVLSLAPLFGLLAALKHGAPSNPGLAGASAGLAASAIAAAIYAWHCPDDSPLFVATWYGLAVCLVTATGYGVGRRMLRW